MANVDELPFKLAIQTVMDEIWYSNALPEWYTPLRIDESSRLQRLRERAKLYLDGGSPLPALRIQVPRFTGIMRSWAVPAVNDQMILQACVASLATEIAKGFDRQRVFSNVPNDNRNRIAFQNPQVGAYLAFQSETAKRLQAGGFVLEFDIERAFASIDREKFFDFFEELKPKSVEVDLLRRLLNAWSGPDAGIPLINDSIFFLGSAYLRVVDREVLKITRDYIRYVDDYRVFGHSQAELEAVFEKISRSLDQFAMKMNPRKVRIASKAEYVQPIADPKYVKRQPQRYVIELDIGMNGQLEPDQIATLVRRSLQDPQDYLNEGYGRFVLGALRRYRLNGAIYRRAGEGNALGSQLKNILVNDAAAVRLTSSRLDEYGKNPDSAWRAIWVIYLIEQQGTANDHGPQLSQIENNPQMPSVVKLWARRCRLGIGGEPVQLKDEKLHDIGYLEAGQQCYGANLCNGEGF